MVFESQLYAVDIASSTGVLAALFHYILGLKMVNNGVQDQQTSKQHLLPDIHTLQAISLQVLFRERI